MWPSAVEDPQLIDLYRTPPGPWLRLNFVASLDGAGTVDGRSAPLSGPADKRVFGVLRMLCDALVVGAGTVRDEGYHALRLDAGRRAWRVEHGLAEYPTLVIVSKRLDLDPALDALAGAPVRPIVLTRTGADPGKLGEVADLITVGDDAVDLVAGVAALRERGFAHLLSEGGPMLFGSLAAAGLVDELCLTVSPLLAGAGAGRIIGGPQLPEPERLTLRHVLYDDGLLFLRHAR
ncbi:pyrimidine reductase family protein [Dactylosporangium sp. CS-033363]|uniref:pyrimidine reductase family protein n=1 Tax=Dactylosporangium sp. CS-033363 TaxID=3239935 RepID=UPI003D8BC9BE